MSQGLLFKNELLSKSKLFGGGGKYDIGDILPVASLSERSPLIQVTNCYNSSSSFNGIIGEDSLYIYLSWGESLAHIRFYNKVTKTFAVQSADILGATYQVLVYGIGDGFCYVVIGDGSTIKKINCATGATVWTYNSLKTMANGCCMKITGAVICIYCNYGNVDTGLIMLFKDTGVIHSSPTVLANKVPGSFMLSKDVVYFMNNYTIYSCAIGSSSILSTTILPSNSKVDYVNQIYYVNTSTSVKAYNYSGVLLWTYTLVNWVYAPNPAIVMPDGLYIHDSNFGMDINLDLTGNLIYTNFGTIIYDINNLSYNYDFDLFSTTFAVSSYRFLQRIFQKVTILS